MDRGEIVVLCRLSNERARLYADIHDITVLANKDNLQTRAKIGQYLFDE